MRKILFVLPLLIAGINLNAQVIHSTSDYSPAYENLPLKLEQAATPVIPDYTVNILDFNGTGDGITSNTKAFSKAIKHLTEKGGGHLVVPRGVWLTGPIRLRDRIDLHLEQGAIITFTPQKAEYYEDGYDGERARSCIYAEKASDISITGKGIIDGGGKYWRYVKRSKVSNDEWNDFKELGGYISEDGSLWFPYNLKNIPNLSDDPKKEESARAHLIVIKRSSRVLISGVTVQNSPRFHINPFLCEDVIIDGVTVKCPWNAQNGDGIDIGNSKRVLVVNTTVDVGDDAICMKGGAGTTGVKNGPCTDILIRNCTVFRGHGAFVIGSEFTGGMEKIVVKDCSFSGTDTGLRFKSAPARGGVCKDIFIEDITMNDIKDEAVTFTCGYADVTYKAMTDPNASKDFYPNFCDIHIDRLVCRECKTAILASGLAGARCVYDVSIKNSSFFYNEKETEIADDCQIDMENVKFATW